MADKSTQQPKGKISVPLGGRQISLAFLIKIGLLPGMQRFFFPLLSHQRQEPHILSMFLKLKMQA